MYKLIISYIKTKNVKCLIIIRNKTHYFTLNIHREILFVTINFNYDGINTRR